MGTTDQETRRMSYQLPVDSWISKSQHQWTITDYHGTPQESTRQVVLTSSRKIIGEGIDKENVAHFTIKMLAFTVQETGPEGEVFFDSNQPMGGETKEGYEDLINHSLSFSMDPRSGMILDVKGAEPYARIFGKGLGASDPVKAVREMLNDEWYLFPNGPWGPGQYWTRSVPVTPDYGCVRADTIRFDKYLMDREQVNLLVLQTVSAPDKPDQGMLNKYGQAYQLSGKYSAYVNAVTETGWMYSRIGSGTLKGSRFEKACPDCETEAIPTQIQLQTLIEWSR